MKMSLTRILSEIKLTVKKLEDLRSVAMVDAKVGDQETTAALKLPIDEAKKTLQSNFDSWVKLSGNLNILRGALVEANAKNSITVGEKSYTIAQAIDRRKNIEVENAALKTQEKTVMTLRAQIAQRHESLMTNFNAQIVEKLKSSSNTKMTDEDIKVLKKTFVDSQEFELIDPVGIESKLVAMREDLDKFKAEVDIKLTEANATISVEVGL